MNREQMTELINSSYTEILRLSDVKPYRHNPKIHTEEQIELIKNSISKHGFINPIIIDENNVIISGHGRYTACERLKMEKVTCIRVSHLSESEKIAFRIEDNKLTLYTDFDLELLAIEHNKLEELETNCELIGFTASELEDISKRLDFYEEKKEELIEDIEEKIYRTCLHVDFTHQKDLFHKVREAIGDDNMVSEFEVKLEYFVNLVLEHVRNKEDETQEDQG